MTDREYPVENKLIEVKQTGAKLINKYIYDIVSIVVVIAIILISLDIFDIKEITLDTILEILASWGMFFGAALILNDDLYKKGAYIGRNTKSFTVTSEKYSTVVDKLTGEDITLLYDFCDEYNNRLIENMQREILEKRLGIPYEWFNDGAEFLSAPLKAMTMRSIKKLKKFTKEQLKGIKEAKKVTIVGIGVNKLLSNSTVTDDSDLGPNDKQMATINMMRVVITYLVVGLLFAVIGIKDIIDWGWIGIVVVLFKAAYTFASSYISYFKGFEDITISYSNTISKKLDRLKEFEHWKDERIAGNN